jgi:hypothetical protein
MVTIAMASKDGGVTIVNVLLVGTTRITSNCRRKFGFNVG